MQEVIDGDYLASSLNLIILRRQLQDIREMMKDSWDEHERITVNIPQWQRPLTETFDSRLSQFIAQVKEQGRFFELANQAAHHCLLKKMLKLKENFS